MSGRAKPEKGPASGREGKKSAEKTTGVSTQRDLGETYNDLLNGWSTFYRDMGNRLSENFAKQQKAYEELSKKWNTFAGSVGKIVEESQTEESQRELYDVWRNYANKVGTRMTKAATEGMKGYGEITTSLSRYSDRITEINREVMSGKVPTMQAEDVYGTWVDVAGKLRHQMDRAAGLTRDDMEDLSRTWLEFSSKMETLVADTWKGEPYHELVDLWAQQSKDVGEAMSGFIEGHDHDYEEMRNVWADHYLRIQESMASLATAIGASYDDMYRRWLEGGPTALSDLPMWPRWGFTEETDSVRDLKRRIGDLEQKTKKTA